MANCSTSVLILSLVIVSSLHSSLNSNPMEAAIKSRHCVARGFVMKIKVVGCQERLVLINSCLGTCVSYSTPSGSRYEQVKSCNCCQQIKTKKVDVGLWCRDRRFPSKIVLYRYYHTVESVTQCACVSCWCSWKKQSTSCLYAEASPPFEFRNFPRWLVFVQRIIVLSLHLLFSFLFLVWTSMLPCTSMMNFVYMIYFSSNCFSGSCDVNLVSISFHKRVTIVFKSPRRLSSTSSLVYFVSFQRKCCRKKLPGIFFKIKRSFCYRSVGRFFFFFFAAGSAIQ